MSVFAFFQGSAGDVKTLLYELKVCFSWNMLFVFSAAVEYICLLLATSKLCLCFYFY